MSLLFGNVLELGKIYGVMSLTRFCTISVCISAPFVPCWVRFECLFAFQRCSRLPTSETSAALVFIPVQRPLLAMLSSVACGWAGSLRSWGEFQNFPPWVANGSHHPKPLRVGGWPKHWDLQHQIVFIQMKLQSVDRTQFLGWLPACLCGESVFIRFCLC